MKRLTLLVGTVAALFLPIHVLAQMPTPIDVVKQLAGDWEGWTGNDPVGITIKGDGSYDGLGRGGHWVAGHIVVKDGTRRQRLPLHAGSSEHVTVHHG